MLTIRQQFRRWRALQWEANSTLQIELMTLADAIQAGDMELASLVRNWLLVHQPYRWSQMERRYGRLPTSRELGL